MLADAVQSHRSWFRRARETVELEGLTLYLGRRDAVLAFPQVDADLESAVRLALDAGAVEIGCWALAPDAGLAQRLSGLGFQDGWQPHWMGVDPRRAPLGAGRRVEGAAVEETTVCACGLPYASEEHESVLGGDVHHFVAREGATIVGHTVLDVDGSVGGLYDMGVALQFRRRGHGRALALAALVGAGVAGCTSVTLNATADGEPVYRRVGFASLGRGMTWWLFPRSR